MVLGKVQAINLAARQKANAWRRGMREALGLRVKDTPTGYVLYQGPSTLDSTVDIVVVVSGIKTGSKNVKTGDMLQVWILRKDRTPMENVMARRDYAICGACPHRRQTDGSRTCYVDVSKAPHAVWSAFDRGSYPFLPASQYEAVFGGAIVRFGAYGDPAAAPVEVFERIARYASAHTGYTHQWQGMPTGVAARWSQLVMASADTVSLAREAWSAGWRTFRVSTSTNTEKGEIECLSESKGLSCAACTLCDGARSKPNIVIKAHGIGARAFQD